MPGGLICALHIGQLFWRSNHSEMQASQKMWLQLRRRGSVICSCTLQTRITATGRMLQCIIEHVGMALDAETPGQQLSRASWLPEHQVWYGCTGAGNRLQVNRVCAARPVFNCWALPDRWSRQRQPP